MLIKRKVAVFSFFSVGILLLTFVVAPWGIGQFLHHTLSKQAALLNENFPNYEYTIQKYQAGIFGSTMIATLNIKNRVDSKTPLFKMQIESNITHGPIFFDFQKKNIQFALAKKTIQIKPEKEAIIQLNETAFPIIFIITYDGKIENSLSFDKISGVINLANNVKVKFDLNNILANIALNINNIYPSYHASIKEAVFSNETARTLCKIKDISINNIFKNNNELSGSSTLVFGLLEASVFDKKILLENCELTAAADMLSNNYHFQIRQNLKKISINNIVYGPLQLNFLMNGLPVQLVKDVQKIQASTLRKNEKDQKVLALLLRKELDIEFILKTLALQMPGGELALNGSGNFITKANFNKIDYSNSTGKYNLKVSKQALRNLLYTIMPPNENIESFLKSIISTAHLIDTGENYESYFVYKNKQSYANGFSLQDKLSTDHQKKLIRPLSPTQELLVAVWSDDIEKVKTLLLNEDVNVNFINPDMKNPIHAAALMGNRTIVNLLLENKIPVDQSDYQGNTALYWAARNGHLDIVQDLLNQGAYPNIQNTNGWTPLQEAAGNGHTEIVELLLQQKNIEINQIDKEGRTALFWAAKSGQNGIIQLLLNRGANRNIANIRGVKPIDIARNENHTETVNLLKD